MPLDLENLKKMEAMRAAITVLEKAITDNLSKQKSFKNDIYDLTMLNQEVYDKIIVAKSDLELFLVASDDKLMDTDLREKLFAKLKDLTDKSEEIQDKIRKAESELDELKSSEFRTRSILLINKQKLQNAEYEMISSNGQMFIQKAAISIGESVYKNQNNTVKRFTSFIKNFKDNLKK